MRNTHPGSKVFAFFLVQSFATTRYATAAVSAIYPDDVPEQTQPLPMEGVPRLARSAEARLDAIRSREEAAQARGALRKSAICKKTRSLDEKTATGGSAPLKVLLARRVTRVDSGGGRMLEANDPKKELFEVRASIGLGPSGQRQIRRSAIRLDGLAGSGKPFHALLERVSLSRGSSCGYAGLDGNSFTQEQNLGDGTIARLEERSTGGESGAEQTLIRSGSIERIEGRKTAGGSTLSISGAEKPLCFLFMIPTSAKGSATFVFGKERATVSLGGSETRTPGTDDSGERNTRSPDITDGETTSRPPQLPPRLPQPAPLPAIPNSI